ncbi:ribonuclease P protein component [Haematospirillum jordaniae]|uniref:Ribonuclease P protein component n=1 Tax=Haematospirillum jordaniae TaxID=1549855 RepID=A0A143DD85_9PROT|nr:ribonuclease P protein component [Haematospirillum jordaniae]AMW34675.1 hypothetical protein AY555_05210 [Haematospirillum jordaniae]NKD44788.1 ribonuclease P protein component [Haematospirillum jordaniae]NKD56978.1 ribonuclease P protein component [Haematospirillum jordaniae]NKD58866.1 ribonuclease P protein component [Haematospirillum jordaniae]NKD66903.1 ribonuclease P protein component [Haematospirillum jordaniae]
MRAAADTSVVVNRLKRRRDFLRVAAERRKWAMPGLIVQAAAMSDREKEEAVRRSSCPSGFFLNPAAGAIEGVESDHTNTLLGASKASLVRVGFTVSKKVGNAVARNRARRRLRAVVDRIMAEHVEPWTDYVIIGRGATVDRPFDLLMADLKTTLARVAKMAPGSAAPMPPRKGGRKKQTRTEKAPASSSDKAAT